MGFSKMRVLPRCMSKLSKSKPIRILRGFFQMRSKKPQSSTQVIDEHEGDKPPMFHLHGDFIGVYLELNRIRAQFFPIKDTPFRHLLDFEYESKAIEYEEMMDVPIVLQESLVNPLQKSHTGSSNRPGDGIMALLPVKSSAIQSPPSSHCEKKGFQDVYIRVVEGRVLPKFTLSEFKLSYGISTCRFIWHCGTLPMMLLYPTNMALALVDGRPDTPPIPQSVTTEEPFQKQPLTVLGIGSLSGDEDDHSSILPPFDDESGSVSRAEQGPAHVRSVGRFDYQSQVLSPSHTKYAINRNVEEKKMRKTRKRRKEKSSGGKRGHKKASRKPKVAEKKMDAEASRMRRNSSFPHIVQAPGGSSDNKNTHQAGGGKKGQEEGSKQTTANPSTTCSAGRNSGRTSACHAGGGAGGGEPPDENRNWKKPVAPDDKQAIPSDDDDDDGEADEPDEPERNKEQKGKLFVAMQEQQQLPCTNILWTDHNAACVAKYLADILCPRGLPVPHSDFTLQTYGSRTSGDQPTSSSYPPRSESPVNSNRALMRNQLAIASTTYPQGSGCKFSASGNRASGDQPMALSSLGSNVQIPSTKPKAGSSQRQIVKTRFGNYFDTPRPPSSYPLPREEPRLRYVSGDPVFEEASSLQPNPSTMASLESEPDNQPLSCPSEEDGTLSKPEPLQGGSGDISAQTVDLPSTATNQRTHMSPSGRYMYMSDVPVQPSSGRSSDREFNFYCQENLIQMASMESNPERKLRLFEEAAEIEEVAEIEDDSHDDKNHSN